MKLYLFKVFLVAVCLLFTTDQTQAAPPELILPIECDVGMDCWVVNYVDRDPGPGVRDYTCGYRTYDGHKGTDFVLSDMEAMRAGVSVLASASGVVRGVRNDMRDVNVRKIGVAAVKGRECGNGLVLAHEDGWETQYCHMRRGSVIVKPGDYIRQGTKLGLVGLSGLTEMPHAHLSVRQNGDVVDPFSNEGSSCDSSGQNNGLWKSGIIEHIGLPQSAVYHSGFTGETPDIERARNGDYDGDTISANAKALVFWADMFWVEPTDKITLSITAPDGSKFASTTDTPDNIQARRIVFVGKKNKGKPWLVGTYEGTVQIKRVLDDGSFRTINHSSKVRVQ